jgi:transcription-repair coupling factor (superfamily II helicase)
LVWNRRNVLSGEELRGKFETKQRVELRRSEERRRKRTKNFQLIQNRKTEIKFAYHKIESNRCFFFNRRKSIELKFNRARREISRQCQGICRTVQDKHKSDQRARELRPLSEFSFSIARISRTLLARFLRDLRRFDSKRFIAIGDLSGGFEIPALDFVVHTETDIFGETTQAEFQKSKPPKTKKSNLGAFISDFEI